MLTERDMLSNVSLTKETTKNLLRYRISLTRSNFIHLCLIKVAQDTIPILNFPKVLRQTAVNP